MIQVDDVLYIIFQNDPIMYPIMIIITMFFKYPIVIPPYYHLYIPPSYANNTVIDNDGIAIVLMVNKQYYNIIIIFISYACDDYIIFYIPSYAILLVSCFSSVKLLPYSIQSEENLAPFWTGSTSERPAGPASGRISRAYGMCSNMMNKDQDVFQWI